MYMVEITEDKIDNLLEHMGKGIKCFNKAMECLESIKEDSRMNERYDEDEEYDYEMNERYGNRGGRSGSSRYGMRRGSGSGRYSRY